MGARPRLMEFAILIPITQTHPIKKRDSGFGETFYTLALGTIETKEKTIA